VEAANQLDARTQVICDVVRLRSTRQSGYSTVRLKPDATAARRSRRNAEGGGNLGAKNSVEAKVGLPTVAHQVTEQAPPSPKATVKQLRIDHARGLVEAAGVEREIVDFSAVFQLLDGARVVVATRCCTDR